MNVKCPKCRFRFDVPASPGMTELQCNCPRCGTPFTFTVDDEQAQASSESMDDAGQQVAKENGADGTRKPLEQTSQLASASSQGNASTGSATRQASESIPGMVPPPVPPHPDASPSPARKPFPETSFGASRDIPLMGSQLKKRGCFKRILIIVACVIIGIIFLERQCSSSSSYDAESLGITEADGTQAPVEHVATPTPSFNDQAPHEKAPSWIQGNWHVDTEYGGISLKIYGDNIAETSGGETSYGHYKYQNHRLYCDFGDNDVFVYRLVEESKQIDAGSGMLMKKIE